MGKPPDGGIRRLLIYWSIVGFSIAQVGAQIGTQEYGCPAQEKISPCRCSTRGMEFQIWCSHSELPSVLEGLRAVSHYVTRPVDELILENNNLPSLPGKVFASLRVLRLMLRNNRLERVSSGWLEGLHDSLLELFVVEPDLRSLPIDSLENLQGLEAITLQSKTMKRLPRFSGLSKLRYLQINSPSLLELSPGSFRDLPGLEELHVFGSPRLIRLEAGLLRNLQRLTMVNISQTGVAWIHPRAMIGLSKLQEISLNDNEISDASIVGRAIVDLPSLKILNLDGNRIERLEEGNFVENPSLNRLSIARNFIGSIDSGAFQRLPELRILNLMDNRIERISPEFFHHQRPTARGEGLQEVLLMGNFIRGVDELRSVLEALPNLKFLDLSRNLLEEIPYGFLRGHPNLERLHLDDNRLSFLQRESFVAMPALRELRLRNNSLTDHLDAPFWNLPGLKGLDLSENYFRRLEPRIIGNLPNLRRLDMSGNGITFVEPSSFASTPRLEHLNVSRNAIASIHSSTLRHLRDLYELDVGWNRLMEVVPGLPMNVEHVHLPMNRIVALPGRETRHLSLPKLRSLDVSANGIERIKPGTFGDLPNLRKLIIGYNSLRHIEDGTFNGLSRLERLDARFNRLVSLHGQSFKPLGHLMDLNLRANRLELIRSDLFQENHRLERLDLGQNNLAQIPHPTFSGTRNLRELYASHNALTELPSSLHGLAALEVLDLSYNKLNILSPETLSSLSSLLELRLVRNRIKELRKGAFDGLPRLTFIDLENNDLRIVERHAIRSLPELQALRLGNNRIKNIPNGAFSELPLLQSAELQDNRIQEIAKNAFVNVPHLLFLNLSNNQLAEMSNVGLESLGSLEVLDLSNNRLSRISNDSFASMEWLVELKMDNNRICGIQGSPFDNMPRLRVLSLRSNRMTSVTEKAFARLRSNIAILDIDGNPLSCSCGMLWLRGWLQQASAEGPRCADGALFREIRLSRQDCQRNNVIETVYPGCQAETIDHSSSSSASSSSIVSSSLYAGGDPGSDSLANWMNLDDQPSKDHQNLEYPVYDDDYVDYPPENSTSGSSPYPEEFPTSSEVVPTSVPSESPPTELPTSTSQAPTKATPPKGSKKPPTRPKHPTIPPSPSSSGFTFFGVPLPNINFNLWGNSRKAQRKDDGKGKISSGRPGRGRYRVFPPTEPEIHRGGFFPLPQPEGGFVPIPDPRFTYDKKIPKLNETKRVVKATERNATVTRVYQLPVRRKGQKTSGSMDDEVKNRFSTKSTIAGKDREEMTTFSSHRQEPAALSSATDARRIPTDPSTIDYQVATDGESMKKDPQTVLYELVTSKLPFLPTEQPQLPTELAENHSIEPLETELYSGNVESDFTSSSTVAQSNFSDIEPPATFLNDDDQSKKIGIANTEERLPTAGKDISAETEDEEKVEQPSSTVVTRTFSESKLSTVFPQSAEILEASALSALLVPGGQVPNSFTSNRPPTGRSSIVKVPSPHLSLDSHADSDDRPPNPNDDQPIDANSPIEQIIGDASVEERVKLIEDDPSNWYFRNYNNSEIEPYVGPADSGGAKIFPFPVFYLAIGSLFFTLF